MSLLKATKFGIKLKKVDLKLKKYIKPIKQGLVNNFLISQKIKYQLQKLQKRFI